MLVIQCTFVLLETEDTSLDFHHLRSNLPQVCLRANISSVNQGADLFDCWALVVRDAAILRPERESLLLQWTEPGPLIIAEQENLQLCLVIHEHQRYVSNAILLRNITVLTQIWKFVIWCNRCDGEDRSEITILQDTIRTGVLPLQWAGSWVVQLGGKKTSNKSNNGGQKVFT